MFIIGNQGWGFHPATLTLFQPPWLFYLKTQPEAKSGSEAEVAFPMAAVCSVVRQFASISNSKYLKIPVPLAFRSDKIPFAVTFLTYMVLKTINQTMKIRKNQGRETESLNRGL
jgi:hypothetical protein